MDSLGKNPVHRTPFPRPTMTNKRQGEKHDPENRKSEFDVPCLCVVMPVYNEERTVGKILDRVRAQPLVQQIIAVDDGSQDGTGECLRRIASTDSRLKVFTHPHNRGKGAAIRTGLAHVSAPVVIIQDGDMEYDPSDYEPMLEVIRQGAEVVYGSRFLQRDESGSFASTRWHRWGNRVLTALVNLATGQRLSDSATCYKMFRANMLSRIMLEEERFGFCPEVTAKISKLGIRITEVPIHYEFRTQAEGKKIRLTDGLRAVYCLVRYTWFAK